MRGGLALALFIGLVSLAVPARADDAPCGWCIYRRPSRADEVAPWARRPGPCRYWGGYVGGGVPLPGRTHTRDEGTFGWDYQGPVLPRYTFLYWGDRYQGGTGAYASDRHKP